MAFVRTSLRGFLQYTKTSFANAIARGENVTLVIGNESADLDSLTSSLLLAYIRSNAPPAKAFSRLYYPVLNIPAKDIGLRPEFSVVLAHANVELSSLITLDDLPDQDSLENKLKPENTQWILVDHNALQGYLGAKYSDRVSGCIDHHEEENKVPKNTGHEPRLVEKTGSCTSHVANYCREAWDNVAFQSAFTGAAVAQDDARGLTNDRAYTMTWDAQIAKVALASILIDTHNLESKDKVTEHDKDAAAYLVAKIVASPQISKDFNKKEYFEEISNAKQDIGRLKHHDVLRKDYKQWDAGSHTLGVSSVVKRMDFLVSKAQEESSGNNKSEAFLEAADAFARDRKLGLFAIMTTSTSTEGDFQRELFLSAIGKEAVKAASKFETGSATELGLAEWRGSISGVDQTEDECWRRIWQQRELQHSRKRVAPLLRQVMMDESNLLADDGTS